MGATDLQGAVYEDPHAAGHCDQEIVAVAATLPVAPRGEGDVLQNHFSHKHQGQ